MRLKDNVPVLPDDMDQECIELCNLLNPLPTVETFGPRCGHPIYRYSIRFRCDNVDVLSRLGRATERNYSDNMREVVVDSTDTIPYGVFWLRSKEPFTSYEEMNQSLKWPIEGIRHWFDDRYDLHFSKEYKH